ncbi:MAG: glucose 1-dehydrogenase [Candidatus Promineifilaceae bacterium]|nr:glucose 1-dehydrogenase [Candidatus Promineifilaceae bacterium]
MSSPLQDRVAIVSGASRGIGEAIASAYVSAGASVTLTSRKLENVSAVAEDINRQHPGRALAMAAHAGDREAVHSVVEQTVAEFGRLDIAVNNAATNPHFGPLLAAEEWQWDKILEVNLKGYFWLCQATAARMKSQGEGGSLINIASVAGMEPGPMMGIYSVSKAGVLMLTKVLAVELAADDIRVNAIAPGFVKTRFSQALWDNPALNKGIVQRTPQARMGEPSEVAGLAVYLASEAASFTTGATFVVDGGYTLT